MSERTTVKRIVGVGLTMVDAKGRLRQLAQEYPTMTPEDRAAADRERTRLQGIVTYCLTEGKKLQLGGS